jgi:hypothetical protein
VAILRRLAAIAAVLTLCAGNLAVCDGWRATPQARMACCDVEPACPLHEPDSHASGSHHGADQAQADGCCAASERTGSATTVAGFIPAGTPALHVSPVPADLPAIASFFERWRAVAPLPPSPVPKHLLLSVFLL